MDDLSAVQVEVAGAPKVIARRKIRRAVLAEPAEASTGARPDLRLIRVRRRLTSALQTVWTMPVTRFSNCQLALPDGSVRTALDVLATPLTHPPQLRREDLYVDTSSGKIVSGQAYFFSSRQPVERTIDLNGGILAPGFIDAQINGAYGVDFSVYDEGDVKYLCELDEVSRRIVETGTTSFVPTIITQRRDLYAQVSLPRRTTKADLLTVKQVLPLLSPRSTPRSAHVLGYHAEGPSSECALYR